MRRMLVAVVGGIAILAMGCGDSSSKSGSGTKDDTGGGQQESDTTAAPGDDTTSPPIEDTSVTPPPEDTAVTDDDKGVTPPPDVDKPKEDTAPPDDKIVGCGPAYVCLAQCAPKTQAEAQKCLGQCASDLPKEEQTKLNDFLICQQDCASVPVAEQQGCIFEKCFDEFHACTVGVEGPEPCSSIQPCLKGCGTDAECQGGCLGQATKEAVKLELAAEACVTAECPTPTLACQQAAATGPCAAAFEACEKDGKPSSKPGVKAFWTFFRWALSLEIKAIPVF